MSDSTLTQVSALAAIAAAQRVATSVAADHAAAVDRAAAFPVETLGAIADARLLAAAAPTTLGGLGLPLSTLARIGMALARGCGASAMIWAMHQLQLACVTRHGGDGSSTVSGLLSTIVADNLLLASATSERGSGGDLRRSHAAVVRDASGYSLEKDSPTVSYGEQAGAFFLSARRNPAAAADDQVAVLVLGGEVERRRTDHWNPMGMRGTCSPGFMLRTRFEADHILPDPFSEIATRTLIPWSQILWSGVWIGLASEALHRAARCLDERAQRTQSAVTDRRMAWADQILVGLEAQLDDAIAWFEAVDRDDRTADKAFRARMNALKLAASTSSVEVAQHALAMCGFAGYQEDGPYSIARLLRDLYSAQVMVSNDRLLDINAANVAAVRAADA
ncbi:acyl-CoA dehydrogenase family protein [Actinocrispum wychmicini]|uniref:Acyl-CoA dehydrogenase n=1 Tax=Actinocrispum wychmicini TaxID=1213861 RepID=A0A4R2K6D1_9PSEU|nr:acyl-CoA dehydrogenase family protein [Actinocrispum wychmicini]TCO61895.1 acyl-CoA dehydrogenase [Actinocrispum wychmicini]